MKHPLDPPHVHQAASDMGKLVAQGLLERGEALGSLLAAAGDTRVDASGLRARLSWALDDATREWLLRRAEVRRQIVRIWCDGDDRGLKSDVLLPATREANAGAGSPLLPSEVYPAAQNAASVALRRRGYKRGRQYG